MIPRILLVEDHEDTRRFLDQWLGGFGYEIVAARCLQDGLKLARDEAFDLYLLDYQFTDGTGKELCEEIRRFDSGTPIIFFSASHPKQQQEALKCGAQGFVLKPDFDALQREVSRRLRLVA